MTETYRHQGGEEADGLDPAPFDLPSPYCSAAEVATYFGVTSDTVRRWAKDDALGFPRGVALGHKALRFRTEEIREWEASRARA